jgi:hypothetical protein
MREIILRKMVEAYVSKSLDESRRPESMRSAREEMDNVLKAIEEIAILTPRTPESLGGDIVEEIAQSEESMARDICADPPTSRHRA